MDRMSLVGVSVVFAFWSHSDRNICSKVCVRQLSHLQPLKLSSTSLVVATASGKGRYCLVRGVRERSVVLKIRFDLRFFVPAVGWSLGLTFLL